MRVVAGLARGRPLVAPAGAATRPTADRVREATFNALHSLGAVVGARAVDLFAGSGALGIEALSRGAAHVTFVDSAPAALSAIRANLAATGLADRARVVRADAVRFAATTPERFDLALVDPPYAYPDDAWAALLADLPAALAAIESDRPITPPAGWGVSRSRRYGGTVVTFCQRARGEPDLR